MSQLWDPTSPCTSWAASHASNLRLRCACPTAPALQRERVAPRALNQGMQPRSAPALCFSNNLFLFGPSSTSERVWVFWLSIPPSCSEHISAPHPAVRCFSSFRANARCSRWLREECSVPPLWLGLEQRWRSVRGGCRAPPAPTPPANPLDAWRKETTLAKVKP